jgi:hypothetical protein
MLILVGFGYSQSFDYPKSVKGSSEITIKLTELLQIIGGSVPDSLTRAIKQPNGETRYLTPYDVYGEAINVYISSGEFSVNRVMYVKQFGDSFFASEWIRNAGAALMLDGWENLSPNMYRKSGIRIVTTVPSFENNVILLVAVGLEEIMAELKWDSF